MVVPKSAEPAATTVVVVLELLLVVFGSVVVVEVVPVSVTVVPAAVPTFTRSVSGNESDAPDASGVPDEQVMAPVPPMAGVMQVQPAGGVMPWNVVLGGVFS